jgi:hypothetical protein
MLTNTVHTRRQTKSSLRIWTIYMNVILTSIECDGCNVIGDSTYGEGLSTGGPWNHPLIDSLVLSSVNTSATCQSEKIMWEQKLNCA